MTAREYRQRVEHAFHVCEWDDTSPFRAVEKMLTTEPEWADNRIAEHVGVANNTVTAVRDKLVKLTSCEVDVNPPTRVGSDGKRRKAPEPNQQGKPAETRKGSAAGKSSKRNLSLGGLHRSPPTDRETDTVEAKIALARETAEAKVAGGTPF